MNNPTRKALILLSSILFLSNAACTTIKPIYADEQATLAEKIQVGDRIRLTYIDGREKDIDVTEVNDTEISGTLHKATVNQRKGCRDSSNGTGSPIASSRSRTTRCGR